MGAPRPAGGERRSGPGPGRRPPRPSTLSGQRAPALVSRQPPVALTRADDEGSPRNDHGAIHSAPGARLRAPSLSRRVEREEFIRVQPPPGHRAAPSNGVRPVRVSQMARDTPGPARLPLGRPLEEGLTHALPRAIPTRGLPTAQSLAKPCGPTSAEHVQLIRARHPRGGLTETEPRSVQRAQELAGPSGMHAATPPVSPVRNRSGQIGGGTTDPSFRSRPVRTSQTPQVPRDDLSLDASGECRPPRPGSGLIRPRNRG